jgi:hypothetical protein
MKTRDTWATWEAELKIRRQQIIEQAGCPMIRIVVDSTIYLLPYSRLLQAECHVREDRYQIRAIWPRFTMTIEGYHLDQLTNLLAEHRLNSVVLRTEIEGDRPEGQPYLERISFASTIEGASGLLLA